MQNTSPVRTDFVFIMIILIGTMVSTLSLLVTDPSIANEIQEDRVETVAVKKQPSPEQGEDSESGKNPERVNETDHKNRSTDKKTEPPKQLFSGTVVLAKAALKKRGIQVADEMKDQAVLETSSGELIPIAADWRGRAFFQDKRLRDRKVELVGYRRKGVPYLQVLSIYFFNAKNQREEMDYWCDICAIPMYEIKDCECCQGPIRLRYRPAKLPNYLNQRHEKTQPR